MTSSVSFWATADMNLPQFRYRGVEKPGGS